MSKNYKNNSKWAVHVTDFEADLFTQGFVSEHTILAAVTVENVHPTADVLLQSLIFLLQPPKLAPAGLPAPSSCGPL